MHRRSANEKPSTSWAVVAHTFNPSTQEAEADRSLSSRPAWSTETVLGQSVLHRETISQNKTTTKEYVIRKGTMLYTNSPGFLGGGAKPGGSLKPINSQASLGFL